VQGPQPAPASPAQAGHSPSQAALAATPGGTAASLQTATPPASGPPGARYPGLNAAPAGRRAAGGAEPETLPLKRPRHSDEADRRQPPGPPFRLRLPPRLQAHLARVYKAAEGMAAGVKAGLEAGLVEGGVEGGAEGGSQGSVSEQGMRAVLAAGLHRLDPCAGEGDCLLLAGEVPAARAGLLHAALVRAVQLERQAAEEQAAAAGGEGQPGQQEQLRACALLLRVQVADVMCGGELSAGQ
jgi:hypothetical protein